MVSTRCSSRKDGRRFWFIPLQNSARVLSKQVHGRNRYRIREYGLDDGVVVGKKPANEQIRELLGTNEVDDIVDDWRSGAGRCA